MTDSSNSKGDKRKQKHKERNKKINLTHFSPHRHRRITITGFTLTPQGNLKHRYCSCQCRRLGEIVDALVDAKPEIEKSRPTSSSWSPIWPMPCSTTETPCFDTQRNWKDEESIT